MANARVTTTTGKKTAKTAAQKAAAPAARKPAAKKPATRSTKAAAAKPTVDTKSAVTAEERQKMIAVAAYLRAESRGFVGGNPTEDWLNAEAEIDQILSRT